MTDDAKLQLILEAQALEVIADNDAWDAWVEVLSDDDFIIYQRWRNGGERYVQIPADAIRQFIEMATAMVEAFRAFDKNVRERGLELLEKLSGYVKAEQSCSEWAAVQHTGRKASMGNFLLPDDSHYANTKMKPLRQYAARR
jgi:hypothetical protein